MNKFDPKKFFLIAGPCVAESRELCETVARELCRIREELQIQVIFKASYIKANRSSSSSYRGPGLKKGLSLLKHIQKKFELPVLTDVHETIEVDDVAEVADILQIPAFLCRQTALLEKVAGTRRWINVKKGQFLAPWDMKNVVEKIRQKKNTRILVTERGSSFGYNNLVVDFRGLLWMQEYGMDVIFDATHSVQLPSASGKVSGGDRRLASPLAFAATQTGVKGYFFEAHPNPEKALSDGPNSVYLADLAGIARKLHRLTEIANA